MFDWVSNDKLSEEFAKSCPGFQDMPPRNFKQLFAYISVKKYYKKKLYINIKLKIGTNI